MIFTITDAEGKIVRRLSAPAGQGIQRVVWDMRYTPPSVSAAAGGGRWRRLWRRWRRWWRLWRRLWWRQGPLVMPGKYTVSMAMRAGGVVTAMPGSQTFNVIVEGREKMSASEIAVLSAFQQKVSTLQRAGHGCQLVCSRGEDPDRPAKTVGRGRSGR